MRNDVPGPALDALVLRLARATAAGMDVLAVLTDVCHTVSGTLTVRGALAIALRRGGQGRDDLGPVAGSDEQFARLGRIQRDAANGPLSTTLRFGRPLLTTDLLRAGPPELAATVAELGVTGSLTIPLTAAGELVGAVQLLGDHTAPVGLGQLEPLAPMLDVLAARLHDARLLEGHAFEAPRPAPVRPAEPDVEPTETQVLPARAPDVPPQDADPLDSATIAIPRQTVDSDTTDLRVDRGPTHGRLPAPRQRPAEPDRPDRQDRQDRQGGEDGREHGRGDRSGGDHPPLSSSTGGRHAAPRPSPRPRPADPSVPAPRHQEPDDPQATTADPDADAERTGTLPTAPPGTPPTAPQSRDPEPPARHPRTAL